MNYLEFLDYVKGHILEYLPDTYANAVVDVVSYPKNGVITEGVTILKDGLRAGNVGLTIELAPLYNMIQNGASLDLVMQNIAEGYLEGISYPDKYGKPDVSRKNIIENLFCAAVNYEETYLKGVPCLQINDLAIIAKSDVCEYGQITMSDYLADYIGVDGDTLLAMAMQNNARWSPPILCDYSQILTGSIATIAIKDLTPAFFYDGMRSGFTMWALTNENMRYGASLISDKNTLSKIAAVMKSDLVILPSSRHELMIAPKGVRDLKTMKSIVEEANQHLLDPEDFLSDNIYVFDAASKEIKMYDSQLHKEFAQARPQKPSGPRL